MNSPLNLPKFGHFQTLKFVAFGILISAPPRYPLFGPVTRCFVPGKSTWIWGRNHIIVTPTIAPNIHPELFHKLFHKGLIIIPPRYISHHIPLPSLWHNIKLGLIDKQTETRPITHIPPDSVSVETIPIDTLCQVPLHLKSKVNNYTWTTQNKLKHDHHCNCLLILSCQL